MSREIRRVPLDFDWPLNEVWAGYRNPYFKHRKDCPACAGTGYGPTAKRFRDEWYGYARFDPVAYGATPLTVDHPAITKAARRNIERRETDFYRDLHGTTDRDELIRREAHRLYRDCFAGRWQNQLIQADVDALIAADRLVSFTHRCDPGKGWQPIEPAPVVTADQVNAWSLVGMGHDCINQIICLRARCEREGVPVNCPKCDGNGDHWPTRAHRALYESWVAIEPPKGDGQQVWETVSEGSPMSPVFATADELVEWLIGEGYSPEAARNFAGVGWVPSAIAVGGELHRDIESAALMSPPE